MNPIDFSIVPRSTMQANNNALFASQRALGDEFENAIGDVAKAMKQEQEAKAKAKALEIEARGLEDWDNPQGMFANSINDNEKKARKLASLLAPFDELLASKWINQADEYAKRKIRADELTTENTRQAVLKNMEIDANLEKDRAGEIKRKEESEAKQKEADAKVEREGLVLSPDNAKTALLMINAGPESYRKFFDMAQVSRIQGFKALPSPNDTPNAIKAQLTAYGKGQVEASTLGADIESVNVGLEKDKLGLSVAKLGAIDAEKNIAFETSDSLFAKVASAIRPAVLKAQDTYRASLGNLDEVNKYIRQIKAFIADGKATSFEAIASIIAFNKTLDAESVVREAEFKIAQNATGVMDSIKSNVASYGEGVNLTSNGIKELNEFVKIIDNLYQQDVINLKKWALSTASSYHIDDRVITLDGIPAPTGGTKVNTKEEPKEEPKVEQKQNAIVVEEQGFGNPKK